MSDAKKCDRCGKFYETVPDEFSQRPQVQTSTIKRKVIRIAVCDSSWLESECHSFGDLCSDCAKSFADWWEVGEYN